MALTATVLLNIGGASQTLTYYLSGVQVDQLVFANNQITFGSTSGFNLSKSDTLLYISSFSAFNNDLIVNFPSVQNSRSASLPLSTFAINLTSAGVEHIYYVQTSLGSSIYNTNYVPLAQASSFAARGAMTITMQEFFLCSLMLGQYSTQVALM